MAEIYLEGSEEGERTACIGPESTKTGETDFHVFSLSPEELYLDLVPSSVVDMLNDKSNWSRRLSAINEIEKIIEQTSSALSDENLKTVMKLVMISMSDSQSKISQKGLQIMKNLVTTVGREVVPYLPNLTQKILVKMGTNKLNLKKSGMDLFKVLMEVAGPIQVLNEIINSGLRYKTSCVREESINVIISALLYYKNGEIQLLPIAKEIVLCMTDEKFKVRQAGFEAIALITSRLIDSELAQVVAMIGNAHKANQSKHPLSDSGLSLMNAYHARMARCSVPEMDEQGLVKYSIKISASSPDVTHSGADVDWISASSKTSHTQLELSSPPEQTQDNGPLPQGSDPPSTFRPYRSAGKRPWETEINDEVTSSPSLSHPTSPAGVPATFHPSSPMNSSTSSKKLPGNSYVNMHLSKLAKKSTLTSPPRHRNTLVGLNTQLGVGSRMDSKKYLGGLYSNQRNSSQRDGLTLEKGLGVEGGANWSMILSSPSNDLVQSHGQQMQSSTMQSTASTGSGPRNSMSITWPRGGMGVRGGTCVPPLDIKGGVTQISADATGVASVQNTVKTNFSSRPLSKPRVRNPLTSLKTQNQGQGISPPLPGSLEPIPNIGSSHERTDSPTQVEQDFLALGSNSDVSPSWGESSFDEEYYKYLIPEDTTLLNNSLSCSLASLCGHRDLESAGTAVPDIDKLKHIRKEAATRKAQFLSNVSNSPEAPRHFSGGFNHTLKVDGPKQSFSAPAMNFKHSKKMTPVVKPEPKTIPITVKSNFLDVDKLYGIGKEEKTYSQNFAKRNLGTSNKQLFKTQAKREREKGVVVQGPSMGHTTSEEIVMTISLEGHGLDRECGSNAGRDTQIVKKKSKNQTHSRNWSFGSQEGFTERRPTIERGGTNTISMEISGVGSRSISEVPATLSQNTKESMIRKKQKYEDDHEALEKKSHSTAINSYKKPLASFGDPDTPISDSTSVPFEVNTRKSKPRRRSSEIIVSATGKLQLEPGSNSASASSSSASSAVRSLPNQSNKGNLVITDMDSSFGRRGNSCSPLELDSGLLETHVHANPNQAIKAALQSIANDDWSSKCEGISMVMCISAYYPNILQPLLHSVLLAIQKEVKNLRSSVAKKAIECLAFLFSTMKRAMEPDLDHVVQNLLHKSGESNAFLREVVDRAMVEMVTNVNPPKALTALINGGLIHRNSHVRKMTSKFISAVIQTYDPSKFLHSSKDLLERTLPAVIQLTKDSSPDVRYYARKCLSMLWPEPDFYQVAGRVLKNSQYTEVRETIETLKVKGIGEPPSEPQSSRVNSNNNSSNRHSTGGSTHFSSQSSPQKDNDSSNTHHESGKCLFVGSNSTEIPRKPRRLYSNEASAIPETLPPEGLVDRLQASNWSERYEAIVELERYIVSTRPQAMSQQLHRVFDVFCPRLTDRNSKVNLHALQAFSNMIPVLHSTLVPILNSVMGTLVPNLASRNYTIHSTAMTVLDLLSHHIDAVHLLPTIANGSQFGNTRIQPIMTRILANLTTSAHMQKPQLVSRCVLPVVWHHVSNRTPVTGEAKTALQDLCRALLDCMGQGFIDSAAHLSMENRKKFDDLLEHLSEEGDK